MTVGIVHTGLANIASVRAAFDRLGVGLVDVDASGVESVDALVLPGVGAFGPAMAALHDQRLVAPLRARIAAGRPTLAICLGLQLLAASSEESPGVDGIGVWDVGVTRLPAGVRVPQLQWNRVAGALGDGWAYFAHSYRLAAAPPGWSIATTDHGGPVIAAVARGPVLACQFHPELSGAWGQGLLRRWLAEAA